MARGIGEVEEKLFIQPAPQSEVLLTERSSFIKTINRLQLLPIREGTEFKGYCNPGESPARRIDLCAGAPVPQTSLCSRAVWGHGHVTSPHSQRSLMQNF
ncbi:hypothetical protein [Kamptonema formosum]|uniref:hypothetical protein n=1 Tax=Kamptonema formosum TaxID=331992 RepID=UPI0004769F5B|nr:hypothetical protein [Oscillatoria sp. PCC 10802]